MSTRPRVICPMCVRSVAIRQDETMRLHRVAPGGPMCRGSHRSLDEAESVQEAVEKYGPFVAPTSFREVPPAPKPVAVGGEPCPTCHRRVPYGPEEVGRIASVASWAATEDRAARTSRGRAALEAKFLERAGGDEELAAQLRSDHYSELARKSAAVRRANRRAAS